MISKNKSKKYFLIISLLLLVLCFSSTVSATQTPHDDAVMNTTTDTPNIVSENTGGAEPVLGASNDENNILSAEYGNFKELDNFIQTSGNNIKLTKDYIFTEGVDDNFINGIEINKTLFIDGDNHIIDAKNMARIFSITSVNVILKNITFINAKIAENGGAIYLGNSNCTISNSNFINNSATEGAGIYISSNINNITINDCNFTDNIASSYGVAIRFSATAKNIIVNRCDFINNTGGSSILQLSQPTDSIVSYCNFENNHLLQDIDNQILAVWAKGSRYNTNPTNILNNVTVDHINFTNNKGLGLTGVTAGLTYLTQVSNIKIVNSTAMTGMVLRECKFVENITIVNSTFSNCAVSALQENMTLSKITIENNTGSGVIADGNNITAKYINITHNTGDAMIVKGNDNNIKGVDITDTINGTPISISGDNVNFTDSQVDEGKAQSKLEMYYAGNDCLAAHLIGYGTSGIYATNPETLNMSNVRVWNGKEYVTISIENASEINLINEPITLKAMDDNNLIIVNEKLTTDESGTVYYDFSNYTHNSLNFVAVFAGDDHYFNSSSEYHIGLGGEFWLLQKYIIDEILNGNNNIKLNHSVNYTIGLDTIVDGILINGDDVTIDGDGCTINAMGMSRIFNINANNVSLKNITFKNANTTGEGAAIKVSDNSFNLTISDCKFINNTALLSGGAIFCDGANATVINCDFINNTANDAGGAIRFGGANATVTDSTFINNTAYTYAGAIVMKLGVNKVIRSQFINNTAILNAGGALTLDSDTTVEFSYFENNTAYQNGGAIYSYITNVKNSYFINNIGSNGGAIYALTNGGTTTISGSHFYNNTAKAQGGAIYKTNNDCDMVIVDCDFENNTATTNAGAILWAASNNKNANKLINTNFTNNKALAACGAVYLTNFNYFVVEGCNFINNSAMTSSSGALLLYGNYNSVDNCNFINNTASSDGGAISIRGSNIQILNSEFIKNTAVLSSGAIYSYSGNNRYFYNCNFTNNTAGTNAGAVYHAGNTISFDYCNFTNNTASIDAGAVYLKQSSSGFSNCNFTNNTAGTNAGAVWLVNFRYNSFTVDMGFGEGKKTYYIAHNNTFINNTATCDGGALYTTGSYFNTLTNYTFINNTAGGYGAALASYDSYSVITLTDVNFTHNRAGSIFTVDVEGTNAIGHLEGKNSYFNALYIDKNKIINYNNVYYWNETKGFENISGKIDYRTIGDNAKLLTPLCNQPVNITALNSDEKIFNKNLDNTNSSADVNYDYGSDGVDYDGARLLFYFPGNDYYFNSGDTGIILTDGDFYKLQQYINQQIEDLTDDNRVITLDRDYSYTVGIDNIIDGIYINESNIIIDGAGYTIDAKNMSRIFNIDANNVTLKNIKLINANTINNGGAVYITGDVNLNNVEFINNTATGDGAALYVSDGTINITIGKFINNTATGNAGGIFGVNCPNANITNSHFINQKSNKGTGAVLIQSGDNVTISGSKFINNTAIGSNGALYILGQYVTIKYSNFINNTATTYGGAFTIGGINATVSNCNFTNNTADSYYGAISLLKDNATVLNCNFTNNSAGTYAGALNVGGSNSIVSDCNFTNNSAGTYAGALNVGGSKSIVSDCKFISNTANYIGALRMASIEGKVINCNFTNNTADTNTGSVITVSNNIIVSGCNFINNSAGTYSGAFTIQGANNDVINCNFTNNSAGTEGGALEFRSTNSVVSVCNFTNNSAGTDGAAIYMHSSYSTVVGSIFINNNAYDDAGVLFTSSNFNVVEGNTFIDNLGVYDLVITGKQNTLLDNKMSNYIYLPSGSIISPTNVTILENSTVNAYTGEEVNMAAVILDDNNNRIIVPDFQFVLDDGTLIDSIVDDDGVMSGIYSFMIPGKYNVKSNVDTSRLIDVSVYNGIVNVTGEEIINPVVNVTAENIDYLEDASIVLNITSKVDGNVNITIKSKDNNYNKTWIIPIDDFNPVTIKTNILDKDGNPVIISNGFGYILNVTDILDAGDYDVFVYLNNSDEISYNYAKFTVNKINAMLDINVEDINYGDVVVVNVTLPKATENVSVIISNDTFREEFDNVVLGENISIAGLYAGIYNVTVFYPGDNNFYDNTTTVILNVDPVEPEFVLSLDNVTIVVGDNTTLTIGINPEVNTTVIVKVNDNEYSVVIVDGIGSLDLNDLNVGVYTINATITDTQNFKGKLTSDNITLTINKINTN